MESASTNTRARDSHAGQSLSSQEAFIEAWIQRQDIPMPEEYAEHARTEARIVPIAEAWSFVTLEHKEEYAADMRRHFSDGLIAEWAMVLDGRPVAYCFATEGNQKPFISPKVVRK